MGKVEERMTGRTLRRQRIDERVLAVAFYFLTQRTQRKIPVRHVRVGRILSEVSALSASLRSKRKLPDAGMRRQSNSSAGAGAGRRVWTGGFSGRKGATKAS